MSKKPNWFRFEPGRGLAFVHVMPDADAGKWFKQFLVDLIMGDSACSCALASSMIKERDAFIESKRIAGEKGASIRYGNPLAEARSAIGVPSHTHSRTDVRTDGRKIKPEDFRTEEVSGDKYAKIQSMPDSSLPAFCSKYCEEGDPAKATGAFKKQMRRIGVEAFRSILLAFVGECESGEEPRNRGSALMARFKKCDGNGALHLQHEGGIGK